jgi:hypothetical protein
MNDMAEPLLISADNLSLGWAQVLETLVTRSGGEISPLTLSIVGFDNAGVAQENPAIRTALDALLVAEGKREVENVAFTIFPERYWALAGKDRKAFFQLYKDAFARIQDFNPQNNRRGSYFQRLVDLAGDGKGPDQLEWILTQYAKRPGGRRSMWQATTYDPARDQSTTAQLEFPCLQQVSFTFTGQNGLVLNAFYATQQIVHKGYGNYLGLCQLGAFMAHEMGRKFARLNVFVGVAKMDKIRKSNPNFQALLAVTRAELAAAGRLKAAA